MKPVAIVGIGCRVPGADGPERLWQLLDGGGDAIREVPPERWDVDALYDPDPAAPGKMSTRWGGFLDSIDGFDAEFFGIAPREAARMDPQQRLLLEVAWEALADGGIAPSGLAGSRTGVFVGVSTYDHGAILAAAPGARETYDGTGSALSILANRLSYLLDLHGPSLAVDTACSSSLVAVHLACRALASGEADLALVGGANVITSPVIAISFSKGGLMAPDGRCKPFDHRADGYVRSEGVAVVALKPLRRAVEDRDRIYAVVLGSAINQDGRSNGLVAPNRRAQEEALRDAYRSAGVDPAEVDYVEAHGTGTAVGDPIEVAALASVLGAGRPAERPLRIGSIKSNLGHLEAAAGVTGLIKAALSLHRRRLAATIHYERPNPMLGLERVPVVVQARGEPWPARERPAVAGVSSFGFGGSNAHVVLGAAPGVARPSGEREAPGTQLVPLSARSEEILRERAKSWVALARSAARDHSWLAPAAAAAALRSDHHRQRAAVVAASAQELAAGMAAIADGDKAPNVVPVRAAGKRAPRVVMVFPGQGSQWAGMGRGLFASTLVFREALSRCDDALARWLGHSLVTAGDGVEATGIARIQPAIFAIQVALAETWRAWGVTPSAVLGQSMGEIAAAHVCGALSLEDAACLVCERSRLLAEVSQLGGLAFVELSHEEALEVIRGLESELSVAAVNGPRSTVLAGTFAALDEVLATLGERGVFARRIAAEAPGHSPQVEMLQPRLREALAGLQPSDSAIDFYSTMSGGRLPGSELDAGYWERSLRAPALLASTIEQLAADGHEVFVEVAPHPVLRRSIAELLDNGQRAPVVVSSTYREQDELASMLRGLGELYAGGVRVDWSALHPGGAPHVALPAHGWRHQRYPVGAALLPEAQPESEAPARPPAGRRGLLGSCQRLATEPGLRVWRLGVDLESAPEIADHSFDGHNLVPGAYWLTAITEAAAELFGEAPLMIEDVSFVNPRLTSEAGEVQLAMRRTAAGDRATFTIASADGGGRTLVHAEGAVRLATDEDSPAVELSAALALRCTRRVPVAEEYERLGRLGLEYGSRFRLLEDLRLGEEEALARVRTTETPSCVRAPVPAALLDSCLHAVAAVGRTLAGDGCRPLPAGVEGLWVRGGCQPLSAVVCHVRVGRVAGRELQADLAALDDEDRVVLAVSGLRVHLAERRAAVRDGGLYSMRWEPRAARPVRSPSSWLVLGAHTPVGHELVRRLQDDGERCLTDDEPPSPEARAEQEREGYDRMLADIATGGPPVRGVVDLRAAHCAPGTPVGELLDASAARALLLAQSLARFPWAGRPPRLWLATCATQAPSRVASGALLAGGSLWGLGRTLAGEHPELGATLVELPDPVGAGQLDVLVDALRDPSCPQQAVLRERGLLVPSLTSLFAHTAVEAPPLRADRTYLVTGGLGRLGMRMARWLAQRGAGHILLVGRREPSPQVRRAIAELRADGVEVLVRNADVGDRSQLARAVADLGVRHPELAGVVHAAGVLESALASKLDLDGLRRALRGKALGAWHLHCLTADRPLEMFVLFSSLAGVAGSAGQAAYAAANSFLDSLALHRAAQGLPALSIAWGPWDDAVPSEIQQAMQRLAGRGATPLDPDVALELLGSALAGEDPAVLAAAFDWELWHKSSSSAVERELFARVAGEPPAGSAEESANRGRLRRAVAASRVPIERRRAMRDGLIEEIASVLQVAAPQVDPTLPFQELGVDSLTAMELRSRLEAALELRLSAALIWEHPTIAALGDELLGRLERSEPDPSGATADPPEIEMEALSGAH